MEHISSRQNPLLRRMRELARGKAGDGEVLLDGPHLLEEACASGLAVRLAAFSSDGLPGTFDSLADRAAAAGARVVTVPAEVMASVSAVRSPTGVLAIATPRRWTLADVLARPPQLVLMLDAVQDPGNVGAIVRAAEACGATGVAAGTGTADPFGPKALRGSMGSTFRLPVTTVSSLPEAAAAARAAGLRIFATVPHGGTHLADAGLHRPSAIVLGGEGGGVTPAMLAAADERVMIDMRPPVESLNVAIAAALLVYEASRQRANVALR